MKVMVLYVKLVMSFGRDLDGCVSFDVYKMVFLYIGTMGTGKKCINCVRGFIKTNRGVVKIIGKI